MPNGHRILSSRSFARRTSTVGIWAVWTPNVPTFGMR